LLAFQVLVALLPVTFPAAKECPVDFGSDTVVKGWDVALINAVSHHVIIQDLKEVSRFA